MGKYVIGIVGLLLGLGFLYLAYFVGVGDPQLNTWCKYLGYGLAGAGVLSVSINQVRGEKKPPTKEKK